MYPEIAFKEFRTQEKIKTYLKSYGIPASKIKVSAGTGLVVDITGTGPAKGKPFMVALRTDIDALPMPELN